MRNKKKNYEFTETKYSDVAKKVLGAYKKLCSKQKIEATTDEVKEIKQNTTDYDFLKKEIGPKAKREFLVLGDTAYFRDFSKNKGNITTLERGKGLISFKCKANYCNEEIVIYGHDETKNEAVVAKKQAKTDSAVPALVTPAPVREIQMADASDKNKADNFLDYELNERLKRAQSGSGTCIGLPEMVPGRYVKIDKLDASVNKSYYLKQVTHTFGDDGFTTEFEIGGWKK